MLYVVYTILSDGRISEYKYNQVETEAKRLIKAFKDNYNSQYYMQPQRRGTQGESLGATKEIHNQIYK